MDQSTLIKKEMVEEYIKGINFNENYSLTEIKNNLRNILGEMPGVEIKHNSDVVLKEDNGVTKRVITDKVQSVVVAFIDGEYDNGVPKVHNYEYFIA